MILLPIELGERSISPGKKPPSKIQDLIPPYSNNRYSEDQDGKSLDIHIKAGPFSAWIHRLWMEDNSIISPYSQEDTFALHFWLSRKIPAMLSGTSVVVPVNDCMLFFLKAAKHAAWPIEGKAISIHVNFKPEALPILVTEFPMFAALKAYQHLTDSRPINNVAFPINTITMRTILRILNCRFSSGVALYYQRRNFLDLFEQYFLQLSPSINSAIGITKPIIRKLRMIRSEICSYPGRDYNYSYFANKYDEDKDILVVGFEYLFKISLDKFVSRERMDWAYHLLVEGKDNAHDIARKIGLISPLLINKDFEDRFGVLPAEISSKKYFC